MTGEEFKRRMAEIFANCDGRRLMNSFDDGFKGLFPTLKVLKEAKEKNEEVTAGDLAKRFDVSTARIARLLNTLEEKGYVKRDKSENDLRKTIVFITDSGLIKISEIENKENVFLKKALNNIPDSDLESFFLVLKMSISNISEDL